MCGFFYIKNIYFLFVYSLPLNGINIRQYCNNSLLTSCYIPVIYLYIFIYKYKFLYINTNLYLSNIPYFSVIHLISYVGINSSVYNANT